MERMSTSERSLQVPTLDSVKAYSTLRVVGIVHVLNFHRAKVVHLCSSSKHFLDQELAGALLVIRTLDSAGS